ncbi:MAG: hypothetical protein IPM79_00725 [Polyangiaceae bacterium]|nr:hypothetical protein [Polyangiaceae bacterium]MBK8936201.1 hypothetical protein [Polyangiaceae bacterium]
MLPRLRLATGLLFTACFATVALVGCGEPEVDAASDDVTAQRMYSFVDVNPDAPLSAAAKKKLQGALAKLDRVAQRGKSPLRRALAAETLARIEAGDVLLGSIAGARGIDRWHMCKDYALPACEGEAPAADDRSWLGDDELGAFLERELDGYQWGNRLYFTIQSSTDVDALAVTLVHEVNHVLNRSECSYYADLDAHEVDGDLAFVEEYRAFLSECYFAKDTSATLEACSASALARVSEYGLDYDLTRVLPGGSDDPELLAELVLDAEEGDDAPFGRLVPREEDWPGAFGACDAR